MATAGYMVDVVPEPTGTQAAAVHVTPPPPPPAGDGAPAGGAAGNGGTPAPPPHPGGDTSLSSLLLSAHHNVVIAGAMMSLSLLPIILPWMRMVGDENAYTYAPVANMWLYAVESCTTTKTITSTTCMSVSVVELLNLPPGTDVITRNRDAIVNAAITGGFFAYLTAACAVAYLVAWVRTFRAMGGVDMCGARTVGTHQLPASTRLLYATMLAFASSVLWSLLAVTVYAGLMEPVRKEIAEAESVTFNAGYAFEVIYLLLAIPACWVAYNFADRMRRAKDAGAPPNHVALLGCLTAPGCNAAANATTGTIPAGAVSHTNPMPVATGAAVAKPAAA